VNTKPIIQVGIALFLLGIVAFTYHGGSDSSREGAVAISSVQPRIDKISAVLISPLLGGIVMVAGIVLVAVGMKKSS